MRRKRIRRLVGQRSAPGWALLALTVATTNVDRISRLQTLYEWAEERGRAMTWIAGFLSTPIGALTPLLLGLAWLTAIVLLPERRSLLLKSAINDRGVSLGHIRYETHYAREDGEIVDKSSMGAMLPVTAKREVESLSLKVVAIRPAISEVTVPFTLKPHPTEKLSVGDRAEFFLGGVDYGGLNLMVNRDGPGWAEVWNSGEYEFTFVLRDGDEILAQGSYILDFDQRTGEIRASTALTD